jgi:hypothetical protein
LTRREGLDSDVYDRGYSATTDDGVWYEVYLIDQLRSIFTEQFLSNDHRFTGFHDLELSCFDDFGQITFFVPNDETKYTLEQLTEILI